VLERVSLIGYRGCGKSTVATLLAERLRVRRVDLDRVIEATVKQPIAEFFATQGEAAFREQESRCLAQTLAGLDPMVLATGGGAVVVPTNRALLRERGGLVIYLHASASVLQIRLARDGGGRPSLTGASVVEEVPVVLAHRDPFYRETAHHVVSADLPPLQVVERILALRGGPI
jgi:shikimate kinase